MRCLIHFESISSQSFYQYYSEKNKVWSILKPYFSPPLEYKNQYGTYRSPLIFYNGDSVTTKDDWSKRREEIRSRWMSKSYAPDAERRPES